MVSRSLAQIFACNIQRKRKILGWSQENLAENLGIGQQSLSRIERGAMAPKFERLPDIAQVLHCSVAELFIDPDEKSISEPTAMIADILEGLTAEEQKTILHFVSEASLLFKRNRSV